ncbi:hypothetical protein M569_07383 [Genlisea aurea]|uniref:Pentacotripeptide-repeat region of PRORP domain-containing protein n=1 Tax=Genlisea aurea TaxID=192259 RepID=S8E4Z8_9LAMI|nr:hypothetical protein M569_07383 [Genlisea aurea]
MIFTSQRSAKSSIVSASADFRLQFRFVSSDSTLDSDSVIDEATPYSEGNEGSANNDFESSVGLDSLETEEVKEKDREAIENLLSLLQSIGTVDGPLEPHLEALDLVFDQELVLEVLGTPQVPGEKLIVFVAWILKKPGFKEAATAVVDSLTSVICSQNRIKEAYALWDFVREIGVKKKGILSTRSLNELIAAFSRLGKAKAAFDVFNSFEEFGCTMISDTYYLTIEALCRRSFFEWGRLVCEKMLNAEKLPEIKRIEKIIFFLCKGGMARDAHLVYLYAKDKKICLSRSCISSLVYSFSRIEKADRGTDGEINKENDRASVSLALELLNEFSVEDRKHATKPFSSVIRKLCWIEDVGRAKDLVLEMIASGPPPGNDAFNCVINGLSKAGDTEEAENVMDLMKSRGLKPDVYTYSVVMSGYARAGEMEKACKIFDEAKRKHSKLTPVAFHSLIRGFCKLEQFDMAVNLLGEMKQHGVVPNHDEYNKLIKSLCMKALDWETAGKLKEEMKSSGLILNGRTSALIEAVKELKASSSGL